MGYEGYHFKDAPWELLSPISHRSIDSWWFNKAPILSPASPPPYPPLRSFPAPFPHGNAGLSKPRFFSCFFPSKSWKMWSPAFHVRRFLSHNMFCNSSTDALSQLRVKNSWFFYHTWPSSAGANVNMYVFLWWDNITWEVDKDTWQMNMLFVQILIPDPLCG